MAKSTSLYLPKGVNNASVTILPADTTTLKTLFTAGADDSDLKSILATTDDTAAVNLKVYVTRSAVDYLIATVNIPLASGSNGTAPAVDILNSAAFAGLPLDSVGKRYIPLKNGDTIKVGCLVTVTTAKTVYVSAFGQDY